MRSATFIGILFSALWSTHGVLASIDCPNLVKIFTADIILATKSEVPPIKIPGGLQLVEPIARGNITGSVFNGTVTGGQATPSWYYNETVSEALVSLFGITDDGVPFEVTASGIGTPAHQFVRLAVIIDGKYLPLSKEFVLASLAANANHTVVSVNAWSVQ